MGLRIWSSACVICILSLFLATPKLDRSKICGQPCVEMAQAGAYIGIAIPRLDPLLISNISVVQTVEIALWGLLPKSTLQYHSTRALYTAFQKPKKTTLGYIHNSSKLSVTSITFRIPFRDSAGLFQTINQQWLPTTPSLPPQPPLRPSTMPLRRTPLPPHPLS